MEAAGRYYGKDQADRERNDLSACCKIKQKIFAYTFYTAKYFSTVAHSLRIEKLGLHSNIKQKCSTGCFYTAFPASVYLTCKQIGNIFD